MIFFTGVFVLKHAEKVDYAFISINRLIGVNRRKSDFSCKTWIMDSGAFSQVCNSGDHVLSPLEYACQIKRWSRCGILLRAVSQDYMCEDFILEKSGKSVLEHQEMTIERYDQLLAGMDLIDCDVGIMPVIQGYSPESFQECVCMYGSRLKQNQWVGVGSIASRAKEPELVLDVLDAIREVRPDLRLHGFGVKVRCLQDERIRNHLFSADSMAWSFAARYRGRVSDVNEALRFQERINVMPVQSAFNFGDSL